MGKHRKSQQNKFAGGLVLGVTASGAVAAAALSGAGPANATCASIGGIGTSADCTSSLTSFAVGLGPNTSASATGLFSGAVANGVTNTGTQVTQASSTGPFDFAYAGGPNTFASANGTAGVAVAQGSNVFAQAGTSSSDVGNAAFNIANEPTSPIFNQAVAGGGNGNLAANLGGTTSATNVNTVEAFGNGNIATTVGGTGNQVFAGFPGSPSTLSNAFAFGGTNNTVEATPGPFNVAGLVNQSGKSVLNNIH